MNRVWRFWQSFFCLIVFVSSFVTFADASSNQGGGEAIERVQNQMTPSGQTIGNIINGRSEKRIGQEDFGTAEWKVKRSSEGGYIVSFMQGVNYYSDPNSPTTHGDGITGGAWWVSPDLKDLFSIGEKSLEDGLPSKD